MRAAVYQKYGDAHVMRVQTVTTPAYRSDELLVRVHASTISSADRRLRSMKLPRGFGLIGRLVFGVLGPRKQILGSVFSGVVEAAGNDVSEFIVGDEVFGMTAMRMGCHAEYVAIPASGAVCRKPDGLGFFEAAALPFGATTCLHFFERYGVVRPGSRILIVGASGAVGGAAVQLAKHFGAHVAGVCSTKGLELVRSLGADEVYDYTATKQQSLAAGYDLIFDTSGTARPRDYQPLLAPGGALVLIAADLVDTVFAILFPMRAGKRFLAGPAAETKMQMVRIAKLAKTGALRPVVGRTFALDDIVEAHEYAELSGKSGSVLLQI